MSRNRELTKQCNALKAELQAGNAKTFVDLLLEWLGRGKPVSVLTGILFYFLLPFLIGFLIAVLLGEVNRWQKIFGNVSSMPNIFVWVYFGLLTSTLSMFVANIYFWKIVAVLKAYVLDAVETQETLGLIKLWVNFLCDKKYTLIGAVLGGLVSVPIVVSVFSNSAGIFIGVGYAVTLFLFSAQSALFFGFLLGTLVFAFNVRYYELTLFESDPAHSEVISKLSGSLNWFVYLVAVYGAVQTFGIVTLNLPYFSSVLIVFWIAIGGVFILSQYGLSQVIQRAKWRTLNQCQLEIMAIRSKKPALTEEDREQLNWLLEYHDRVKATRNSAFDASAGLSLLNSLFLPLIGFLLGNVDVIVKFLH